MYDGTVKIPIKRYEELLKIETRVSLLADYTKKSEYSIRKEEVAHYLAFNLPAEKVDDNV